MVWRIQSGLLGEDQYQDGLCCALLGGGPRLLGRPEHVSKARSLTTEPVEPRKGAAVERHGPRRRTIHALRTSVRGGRGWRAFARHDDGTAVAIFSHRGGGAANWLTLWLIFILHQANGGFSL